MGPGPGLDWGGLGGLGGLGGEEWAGGDEGLGGIGGEDWEGWGNHRGLGGEVRRHRDNAIGAAAGAVVGAVGWLDLTWLGTLAA